VGVWYSFGPEGYIDFPTYQESAAISWASDYMDDTCC
jgi:hypothetical protein